MRVLISGGGIGGLTVANLLHKQGHQPIVIDKARAFSDAGFVISLKSFGVDIMNEIGLEEKMRLHATKSNLLHFFKSTGKLVRGLDFATINKNLADNIMAPRASVHQVLYEAVKNDVDIRFNTTIKNVEQTEQEVIVQLSDDSIIKADLLIIAEGVRSTTRNKIWAEATVEDFNIFYAAGRISGKHSYQTGNYLTYRGVKKIVAVLPLNENELAVQCYIHNTDNADNILDIEKGLLSETFKDFHIEALDLIKKMEAKGGFFSDKIAMVHTPVLYKNKIVLLGDAGYCPTSLSGMGASLAIFGAKALVHYIMNSPGNLSKALENYNNLMQPIVKKFQSNARVNAKTFLPMSQLKLRMVNIVFKYIPQSQITKRVTNELTLTKQQRNFVFD